MKIKVISVVFGLIVAMSALPVVAMTDSTTKKVNDVDTIKMVEQAKPFKDAEQDQLASAIHVFCIWGRCYVVRH